MRPTPIALMLLLIAGTAGGQEPALESERYSETVQVELLTVPFYAVDANEDPVFDLEARELELWVDGRRVEVAAFDRYGAPVAPQRVEGSGAAAERLLPPTTRRHVLMLFDLAFSTPRGVLNSRQAAEKLLAQLPDTDWIYLLTYHSQRGFEQKLGPVPADGAGRARVLELVGELRPNIERLRLRADLPTIPEGSGKNAQVLDNVYDAYIESHAVEQTQYATEARAQADALQVFATFVRQLHGPKLLLYFSQGLDSGIYNEGVQFRDRHAPVRGYYEPALQALAQSGAMPLFVNTDLLTDAGIDESTQFQIEGDANAYVNSISRGESTLQQMAEVSGGKVLAHVNTEVLADRVVDWTSAYYELGYYPSSPGAAEAVEVRVKRPGVSVWTPKGGPGRRPFEELTVQERRFLITDLVFRGPQGEARRTLLEPRFLRLEGEFAANITAGQRKLRFEPVWPRETLAKSLELYSVVIEVTPGAPQPRLLKLDRFFHAPVRSGPTLTAEAPAGSSIVWGVVGVEAATGSLYVRRIHLQPEAEPATLPASTTSPPRASPPNSGR
ncbi:MAG TPA: hypothetical protein VF017_03125 [Thermoanaerobaculia bacterium]|nr:hypothetical protein [Thermoanaerobaculia bacterium]